MHQNKKGKPNKTFFVHILANSHHVFCSFFGKTGCLWLFSEAKNTWFKPYPNTADLNK